CVGRDDRREDKIITIKPPFARDRSARRAVSCGGVSESAVGEGADDDVLVAGAIGIDVDAGDVAVEPVGDGTEGVVVEGVHPWVLEPALLGPAVPALP